MKALVNVVLKEKKNSHNLTRCRYLPLIIEKRPLSPCITPCQSRYSLLQSVISHRHHQVLFESITLYHDIDKKTASSISLVPIDYLHIVIIFAGLMPSDPQRRLLTVRSLKNLFLLRTLFGFTMKCFFVNILELSSKCIPLSAFILTSSATIPHTLHPPPLPPVPSASLSAFSAHCWRDSCRSLRRRSDIPETANGPPKCRENRGGE